MTEDLKMLTPEDLSRIIGRAASTIKVDARRRPHTLPPRIAIPGSNRLRWLEKDVLEWIDKHRQVPLAPSSLIHSTARGKRIQYR